MSIWFIKEYENVAPKKQSGEESFYKRRNSKDSKMDIDKTIKESFNLLRVVDNNNYPAFFEMQGNCYTLKIEKK